MADWLRDVEPLTLKGQIKVPYTWSVGETGSRFLTALRDKNIILGNRCGLCETVYVPPRKNCGKCFEPVKEWVSVGTEGTVEAFTIVRYGWEGQPLPPPFAYALIRLDGADAGFLHLVRDRLRELQVGTRVRARFAPKPRGHILDIEYFEIL